MAASVLFVCLGNICRSPAAEGVMRKLVADRGLSERLLVESAGTSSFHIGEPPDRRMREAASQRGYDLVSRSRQATRRDYTRFDRIVAMDRNNYRELASLFGEPCEKLRLLSDYLENNDPRDVPDPYYYGEADGFQEVLNLLEAACPKLLEDLIAIDASRSTGA